MDKKRNRNLNSLLKLSKQIDKLYQNTYITKMAEAFNEQQFRDVFTVTEKIKTKLQPFIAKYREQNMTWIMRSFEQLHRMFFENEIDIVQRFNSIFGIKFIFDIGEVIIINLIEIYFLPKILQIASYELQEPEEKRGITYFLNNGYSNQTPNVQRFGYNYVRMASEFIINSAVVKPNRLFDNQPYNQPSEYSLPLKKLQEGGWKMYASLAYYKEGTVQHLKALYDKSLEELEDVCQLYIEYFSAIFKKFIIDEKPFQSRLDPKKILQFGDTYITPNVIGLCADYLRSNNFRAKKNSLYLLNYLIKWGDIEAAHEVNCTNLLDKLLYEVVNPEVSSKILARGKNLFKKSQANEQEKQQLYNQLLKDIQFWSLCHPNGIKDKKRHSKIKMVHDQFRSQFQLQFPDNKDLKQDKAIFDEQIKKNKMRNSFLLKQLKETDPQPQSYVIIKNYQKILEPTPLNGSTFNDLLKQITEIQQYITTLCQNKGQVHAKINKILFFQKTFEQKMEEAEIDDDQLNEIVMKWDELVEKINKMAPVLKQYQNHQINFQELSEAFSNKKSPKKQNQRKKDSKQKQPALDDNNLKAQGCMYLSKVNCNNLQILSLMNNNIGAEGCLYLAQANWKQLNKVALMCNSIGDQGCGYLAKAQWSNLRTLDLKNNNIKARGCQNLLFAPFQKLQSLSLDSNNIGDQGCKYLSQGKWFSLQTLELASNNIGAEGCRYLSRSNWDKLQTLSLGDNNIGSEGCRELLAANWNVLQALYLHFNKIGRQDYKMLKTKFRQIYCQWQYQE